METFKERWWNQNPAKKVCDDEDEDTGGGISIYNIGKYLVTSGHIGFSVLVTNMAFLYNKSTYRNSQKHESTLLHTYVLNEFLTADRSFTTK